MSKWDTSSQRREQAKQSIDTAQTKSDTMAGEIYNPMLAERPGAVNRGLVERENIRSGYQNLADTGGGYGGSSIGMRNPSDFGSYAGWSDFAKTGGYTDQDIQNVRARSTSGIPALYATNKANAARQASIQGGYSPGYTGAMAKMQRGSGQSLTDAARNAEVDIASNVRSNRMAGLSGMTDVEKAAAMQQYYDSLVGAEGNRLNLQAKATGLAGLSNLYGISPGEQEMYDRNMMNMYGMQTGANQGLVNSRVALAGQGDWLDQGFQGMSATGGMLGGLSNAGLIGGGAAPGTIPGQSTVPGLNAPPVGAGNPSDQSLGVEPGGSEDPAAYGMTYGPQYGGSYNNAYNNLYGSLSKSPGAAGYYGVPYQGTPGYSNYGMYPENYSPYGGGGGGYEVSGRDPYNPGGQRERW